MSRRSERAYDLYVGHKYLYLCYEEKAGKVHILKKNIGDLKAELYLCITPESGLLRFAVPSKNVLKDISLEESGLVSVFYDFCENLSPELFYSEEEAKRIIFG